MSIIVRCYVSLTIGQKEIGERIQEPQQSPAGDVLKASPEEWRSGDAARRPNGAAAGRRWFEPLARPEPAPAPDSRARTSFARGCR